MRSSTRPTKPLLANVAWWRRAIWRVRSHRTEALAVSICLTVVSIAAAAAGLSPWLADVVSRHSVVGDLLVGLAAVWVPLMVIDMRMCSRERALRTRVEAELVRSSALTKLQNDELDGARSRITAILAVGGPDIAYQPIVELATRGIVGFEALSRFGDGSPPDEWFAMAWRAGLGVELELAAVANALKWFQAGDGDVFLSVNMSPSTLVDRRLKELMEHSMPGRLVLEITEHAVVDDYGMFEPALSALRALGVRIAVDDAGSGYAGLRHILDLHPEIIKIDGSLVRGIHTDSNRRSLMAALVSFADDLGALLVAECIEVEEESQVLGEWGVRYGQGWLYGAPQRLGLDRNVRSLVVG